MNSEFKQFWRAVWQYLNQPVFFNNGLESIWKPSRFWYMYKIRFLEACWYKDSVTPNHDSRGQDEYRTGN